MASKITTLTSAPLVGALVPVYFVTPTGSAIPASADNNDGNLYTRKNGGASTLLGTVINGVYVANVGDANYSARVKAALDARNAANGLLAFPSGSVLPYAAGLPTIVADYEDAPPPPVVP